MTLKQVFELTFDVWGMFFCILAGAVALFGSRGDKTIRRMAYLELGNALLLGVDALCWQFRGVMSTAGYYVVRIANPITFFFGYMLLYGYLWYLSSLMNHIDRFVRILKWIARLALGAEILLIAYSIPSRLVYYIDEANLYHRTDLYFLSQIGTVITMACCALLIYHLRKWVPGIVRWSLYLYLILPMIATIVQLFVYGLSLTYMMETVALVIAFFVSYAEHSAAMLKAERELDELQLKMMMSQIQPHFLYNSLNSIYYLCGKNPQQAQEAISDFSDYLRANLDSLKEEGPVPFERELNHVENYLKLEQLRFGEELSVIYNIRDLDFEIPALTIQPLVENAVKYGVGKKKGGGNIWISSEKTSDGHRIIIRDDGIGFDWREVECKKITRAEGKSHIGMDNVKKRLEMLSGAEIKIESVPGTGTTVTIEILDS